MKTIHRAPEYVAESVMHDETRDPIAMLNITRTITDHIPMMRDPDSMGLSIGQQIDNHLAQAARERVQIQTVALEFERDSWLEFAAQLRGDPRRA